MIGLILAAGDAERLEGVPKPYIRVGYRSPAERMAAAMRKAGLEPYIIARVEDQQLAEGIDATPIMQHPMSPARRVREALLESVSTPAGADRRSAVLQAGAVIAMGDMLFTPEPDAAICRLLDTEMAVAGSLVMAARHPTKAGLQTQAVRVTRLNPTYVRDIGIHRIHSEIQLPEIDGSVISMLLEAGPMEFLVHEGQWWDLATPRDLVRAQALFTLREMP